MEMRDHGLMNLMSLLFSDIKVIQKSPFNTTIHFSLNVGNGSKVMNVYFQCSLAWNIAIITPDHTPMGYYPML